MQKTLFGILILVMCTSGFGQEIAITRDGEMLPATKGATKLWHVQMDGEDFFLLQRSKVDGLTRKIDSLKAVNERHEKVLAAYDSLLKKYATFEESANEHIDTQKALIQTADSLFTGYKSLYTDLKKVVGLSTFSLATGVGWVLPPGEPNSRPVGAVGLGYQNWIGMYQFGKDFHGVTVYYRLPLGF